MRPATLGSDDFPRIFFRRESHFMRPAASYPSCCRHGGGVSRPPHLLACDTPGVPGRKTPPPAAVLLLGMKHNDATRVSASCLILSTPQHRAVTAEPSRAAAEATTGDIVSAAIFVFPEPYGLYKVIDLRRSDHSSFLSTSLNFTPQKSLSYQRHVGQPGQREPQGCAAALVQAEARPWR